MAHIKAGGSTKLGRDSQGQRLGTKKYAGERVKTGNIIVRQRGSKIRAGINVRMGKDDTLYAVANGIVKFTKKHLTTFDGNLKWTKFANVMPLETTK
ncbi:MAG: 50S ribosomal protein L27 [Patescibacteria group bacterium]|nr:50S ribosomal protein L27 [Patescibacteria group bacterium]